MVQARIYRPAKTAMQSGRARRRHWILEFCPRGLQFIDPLMGWRGSKDTLRQLRLPFHSLDAAMAYVKKKELVVQVKVPHSSVTAPRNYADNFRYDRVG